MEKIDRLHGVVIKQAQELCVGDIILDHGSFWNVEKHIVRIWRGPELITVRDLELQGDDVAINDGSLSTSIGNKFMVLADNSGNPLRRWNVIMDPDIFDGPPMWD